MKYIVKNLVIDVLAKPVKGKGERNYIPKLGSPSPCWTTSSTCWCTCGGCTTLTRPLVKSASLSRFKDVEKALLAGIKEVRRRQALLKRARLAGKKLRRAR